MSVLVNVAFNTPAELKLLTTIMLDPSIPTTITFPYASTVILLTVAIAVAVVNPDDPKEDTGTISAFNLPTITFVPLPNAIKDVPSFVGFSIIAIA